MKLLFVMHGTDAPRVYVRAWTLCCFQNLTQTFRRALTVSVDSCAEITSVPSCSVINQFWQTLKEGAGKRCSECVTESAVHRFCPIMNVSGYIYSCRHRLVPGQAVCPSKSRIFPERECMQALPWPQIIRTALSVMCIL